MADGATGILTVCQGVTKSFRGLVVCRVLIGVFEAGFMPGEFILFCLPFQGRMLTFV
jgi:hypothetical protein